jgi:sortase B
MACGTALSLYELSVARSYVALAEQAHHLGVASGDSSADDVRAAGSQSGQRLAQEEDGDAWGEPDWETLLAINEDLVAWLQVDGTSIDLPVVQAGMGATVHYLTHDFWGRPSQLGCPFLDARAQPDGRHLVVYGHHLSVGGMFSDLQHAHEQACFSTLGTCRLWTRQDGMRQLDALCALRVDQTFADIQRFDFAEDATLDDWLMGLVARSTAASPKATRLARDACRALTLVTCADDMPYRPWRTIVVFVEHR